MCWNYRWRYPSPVYRPTPKCRHEVEFGRRQAEGPPVSYPARNKGPIFIHGHMYVITSQANQLDDNDYIAITLMLWYHD